MGQPTADLLLDLHTPGRQLDGDDIVASGCGLYTFLPQCDLCTVLIARLAAPGPWFAGSAIGHSLAV